MLIQPVAQAAPEDCDSPVVVMDGGEQKVALCADDPSPSIVYASIPEGSWGSWSPFKIKTHWYELSLNNG